MLHYIPIKKVTRPVLNRVDMPQALGAGGCSLRTSSFNRLHTICAPLTDVARGPEMLTQCVLQWSPSFIIVMGVFTLLSSGKYTSI